MNNMKKMKNDINVKQEIDILRLEFPTKSNPEQLIEILRYLLINGSSKQHEMVDKKTKDRSVISRNIKLLGEHQYVKTSREDQFDNRPTYSLTFMGVLFLFLNDSNADVNKVFTNFNDIFNANFSSVQISLLKNSVKKQGLIYFFQKLFPVLYDYKGNQNFKKYIVIDFKGKDLLGMIREWKVSWKGNSPNSEKLELEELFWKQIGWYVIGDFSEWNKVIDSLKFQNQMITTLKKKEAQIIRKFIFEVLLNDYYKGMIDLYVQFALDAEKKMDNLNELGNSLKKEINKM